MKGRTYLLPVIKASTTLMRCTKLTPREATTIRASGTSSKGFMIIMRHIISNFRYLLTPHTTPQTIPATPHPPCYSSPHSLLSSANKHDAALKQINIPRKRHSCSLSYRFFLQFPSRLDFFLSYYC